MYSTVIEDTLV